MVCSLVAAWGSVSADSFDRQPLTRVHSTPITMSGSWTIDAPGEIDRQPEITLMDPARGRYALTWTGHDGKRKEITYYEPDRVQVILRASVSAGTARKFRYQYEIMNRRTSGQDVFGIVIQTFADDVQVVFPADGRFIGPMTKVVPEFSVGTWYLIPFKVGELSPGSVQRLALESDSPPSLVYARAHGGPLGMKGVGEEPPEVLEASLPGFEVWPLGLTIGPVTDIRSAQYVFGRHDVNELVELIAAAGWLSSDAKSEYQRLIDDDSYAQLLDAFTSDVGGNRAAPEVVYALTRFVKQLGNSEVDAIDERKQTQ